jgi:hypothetical protein
MKPGLGVLVVAACGTRAAPVVIANTAKPSARLAITAEGIGPVSVHDIYSLKSLIASLRGSGYTVDEVDNKGLEYHVSSGDEELFYVIPDDNGGVFNVHATSPRIAIADHPDWHIGAPITSIDALSLCDCWGRHSVCFKSGEHVAIAFDEGCGVTDLRVLIGKPIRSAVWSPAPFAEDPKVDGDIPLITP